MFEKFGLLLEVLRLGLERIAEEFELDLAEAQEATIEQESWHVFMVQVDQYCAWVYAFDGEAPDCYYADDMTAIWK